MLRGRWVVSDLFLIGIATSLGAQTHDRRFVEASVGMTSSTGGDYEERNLYNIHVTAAQLFRTRRHHAAFAGLSVGLTARNGSSLTCRLAPQGGCVPLMPTMRYATVVTGVEARKGIASFRIVVGPGVSRIIAYEGAGSNMTVFHGDGALEAGFKVLKHTGILVAAKTIVMPNLSGASVIVTSVNIGIGWQ